MSQDSTLKIQGLFTHPSDLSEVPEGALELAKNINIDKESIATLRRGVDRMGYGLGSSSDRANKIFEYQDTLLIHYNTSTMAYDTGSAWSDYSGTFAEPDSSTPVRAAKAQENFFLTTASGIKKLDAYDGSFVSAGAPKGLTVEASLAGNASGWFEDDGTNGNAVAYRVLWGYEDANGNLILGAPSQRTLVTIDTGTGSNSSDDVDLELTIPDGITTDWIFQVYRSAVTDNSSVSPSDELFLVYEDNPSATSGTITITDQTATDLTGATLYTSPSQETIAQANERPPFAKDITTFKNHMFYGNVKGKHRRQITLLAALSTDDQLTITGINGGSDVTFTAKGSTTVANNEFETFTSGTVSQNIRDTALELCKVINQSSDNTGDDAVYAFYISAANELPGKIILESREVGGAEFSLTFDPNSGSTSPWDPRIPTTASGNTVDSDNDEFKNGLYFSKPQQPEAVPLVNFFQVGSSEEAIKRILPLRDSLFILKEDGVYRLTGEGAGSFRVELFDSTARIIGAETAVTLNNAIYFFSDQGVAQCTETGITVISRPIESDLVQLLGASLSGVKNYSFAVGYETERKYILGLISQSGDTNATQYYVYNTFTQAWTRWDGLDAKTGLIKEDNDKLYLADVGSEYVLEERKSFNNTDYVDYNTDSTISSISSDGLTVTLSNTDQMAAGDVIYQSDSAFAVIKAVDSVAGTATVYFSGNLSTGAATIYSGIDAQIQWAPIHGGNPSIAKHFRESAMLFKRGYRLLGKFGFSTDLSGSVEEVDVSGGSVGNWGAFTWGSIPWGGAIGRKPKRTYVPREKSRATQMRVRFTHRIGFSDFELYGVSVYFNAMSERFSK